MLFLYNPADSLLLPREAAAEESVIETVEKVIQSVVAIKAEGAMVAASGGFAFKNKGRIFIGKKARAVKFSRVGAGVIINSGGFLVANAHTVKDASRINVTLYDNSTYKAKVVWMAEDDDVAFISISRGASLPFIRFCDVVEIKLGTAAYAVLPSGILKGRIAQGKVTGIGKRADAKDSKKPLTDLLRINISMHKGNSGVPFVDKKGRLLGILTAGETKRPYQSYAIPSERIAKYYRDYLKSSVDSGNEKKDKTYF
ncbi:MAG: serine protease [Candidatus Omnitrophica bacterium]|nr:serine protease [Candidatus Omnitrophota bacterium]